MVLEKSRGLGGRTATRRLEPAGLADLGAQFFSSRNPKFMSLLQDAPLKEIRLAQDALHPRFIHPAGMSRVAHHLAEGHAESPDAPIVRGARVAGILPGLSSSGAAEESGRQPGRRRCANAGGAPWNRAAPRKPALVAGGRGAKGAPRLYLENDTRFSWNYVRTEACRRMTRKRPQTSIERLLDDPQTRGRRTALDREPTVIGTRHPGISRTEESVTTGRPILKTALATEI